MTIFQNWKSISFDIEELTFIVSIDFEIFENFQILSFFMKQITRKNYFRKSSSAFR